MLETLRLRLCILHVDKLTVDSGKEPRFGVWIGVNIVYDISSFGPPLALCGRYSHVLPFAARSSIDHYNKLFILVHGLSLRDMTPGVVSHENTNNNQELTFNCPTLSISPTGLPRSWVGNRPCRHLRS
jgi:hypothetical protein